MRSIRSVGLQALMWVSGSLSYFLELKISTRMLTIRFLNSLVHHSSLVPLALCAIIDDLQPSMGLHHGRFNLWNWISYLRLIPQRYLLDNFPCCGGRGCSRNLCFLSKYHRRYHWIGRPAQVAWKFWSRLCSFIRHWSSLGWCLYGSSELEVVFCESRRLISSCRVARYHCYHTADYQSQFQWINLPCGAITVLSIFCVIPDTPAPEISDALHRMVDTRWNRMTWGRWTPRHDSFLHKLGTLDFVGAILMVTREPLRLRSSFTMPETSPLSWF